MSHLDEIVAEDLTGLAAAQESYGDSWRKRGGVGAFMMLARKWDRIERQVVETLFHEMSDHNTVEEATPKIRVNAYDVFGHVLADERAEGLIDDIRDLRRYLLLVEGHLRDLGVKSALSQHRDNREFARLQHDAPQPLERPF